MSFFVNAPQEEAFRLVMDYFKGRRVKVLASNPPSHIRAEFGSLASMSLGNAKGEVEINVVKRNSRIYISLNFDFIKEYLATLLIITIGALIIPIIYGVLEADFRFTLFIVSVMAAIVVVTVGYDVSLTRRRFIEEFNMFIQSLAFKKD